jgi:hypothetical protein
VSAAEGTSATTFHLARATSGPTEWHKVTVTPMRCPMLHGLPAEVSALVAEGWRVTGHIDHAGGAR